MQYCLKCGAKVEDANTFCPCCGTQLKDPVATPDQPHETSPQVKADANVKPQKPDDPQKEKKLEKPDYGFVKYLAAGLILITVGVAAILELTNPKSATCGLVAIVLFFIGLIVIVAAVYVVFAGRKHDPCKQSDISTKKAPVQQAPLRLKDLAGHKSAYMLPF